MNAILSSKVQVLSAQLRDVEAANDVVTISRDELDRLLRRRTAEVTYFKGLARSIIRSVDRSRSSPHFFFGLYF
jgi:hypothetical protein